MTEARREYLFVYGSLQRKVQHPAHNVLSQHAEFVCNAEFEGALYMVSDYPGAVKATENSAMVKGELFLLKDSSRAFAKLDRYEGYDPNNTEQSLYVREQCAVRCSADRNDMNVEEAWIYLFNRPTDQLERISSGDYLAYIGKT